MREWYAANELAGLPSMPATESGVIRAARREGWQSRKRSGRGGGREYHLSSLRAETAAFIRAFPERVGRDLPRPTEAERSAAQWMAHSQASMNNWMYGELSFRALIGQLARSLLALAKLRARLAGDRHA